MLILERAHHFQPEPVESGHHEVADLALFSVSPHCRNRDRFIDHDIVPGDGTEQQHVEILLRLPKHGVPCRYHFFSEFRAACWACAFCAACWAPVTA